MSVEHLASAVSSLDARGGRGGGVVDTTEQGRGQYFCKCE